MFDFVCVAVIQPCYYIFVVFTDTLYIFHVSCLTYRSQLGPSLRRNDRES